MKIVNLTPHNLTIRLQDHDITVPPSGTVARVKADQQVIFTVTMDGHEIPVVRSVFGTIEGLPDPQDGVLYVVSTLVAQAAAAAGRRDVVAPDTGPDSAIRDADGKIVAVRRFQQF